MTDRTRRNVVVLALCQALMMIGAIDHDRRVGAGRPLLATNKSLATLPLASHAFRRDGGDVSGLAS